MKRLALLVAVLLTVASAPAAAQIDVKPGVRLGVALSSFRGDDIVTSDGLAPGLSVESDFDRRVGPMVGGVLLIDLPGPVALQPELLYVRKGSNVTVNVSGTLSDQPISLSTSLDVTVDYVQVPVLGKLQIPIAGPYTPTVFAGPAVAVKVSEDVNVPDPDLAPNDGGDIARSVDAGLVFGAGVDVEGPGYTILFDTRYDLGLRNLSEDDAADLKNGSIALAVGVVF